LHLRKKPKNNEEPLGSLLSFPPEKKNQETMANFIVHCCLLHLQKKPRNNYEPPNTLSSSIIEEKTKKGSSSSFEILKTM
jgi:hypothetical protein